MPKRIERLAAQVLEQWGPAERPLPVEEVARSRGIEVVFDPLESTEDVSGFYFRDGDRRVIGVNSAHAPVRQRFTIAHELGHALLHDAQGLHLDQAFKFRDSRSALAVDPDEMDANAFAAALLMPEDEVWEAAEAYGLDINDDAAMRKAARHFGVSVQALSYRLANLRVPIVGAADL
ncbi:MAG TPA: ImmA/IrrE family metallo-endopeptidase [Candidatus Limnocylindrales bacterium]|nr:ImmA/IrrE family metallo-endopeptidase [Candidatus Limnocylindrales bacterium]